MLVLGTALQINLLVEKTILRKGGEHMRVICINIQRASWNMVCCIFLGLEVTFFIPRKGQSLNCCIAMLVNFLSHKILLVWQKMNLKYCKQLLNRCKKTTLTLSNCCSLIFHPHSTNQKLGWGVLDEGN